MFMSLGKCSHWRSDYELSALQHHRDSKTHLKNSPCCASPCAHTVLLLFWLDSWGLVCFTCYYFQSMYSRWVMNYQLSLREVTAGAWLQFYALGARSQSQVPFLVCIQDKQHADTHPRQKCGLWHVRKAELAL